MKRLLVICAILVLSSSVLFGRDYSLIVNEIPIQSESPAREEFVGKFIVHSAVFSDNDEFLYSYALKNETLADIKVMFTPIDDFPRWTSRWNVAPTDVNVMAKMWFFSSLLRWISGRHYDPYIDTVFRPDSRLEFKEFGDVMFCVTSKSPPVEVEKRIIIQIENGKWDWAQIRVFIPANAANNAQSAEKQIEIEIENK